MRTRRFFSATLLLALLAVLAGCGSRDAELERLRAEQEALRAELRRLKGEEDTPDTPADLLAHFANDRAVGTLAGLAPGTSIAAAQARFGPEARTRTWHSEAEPITQYEWELSGGVFLRLNAEPDGYVRKVAVAFANPRSVRLPTLAGIVLGEDTFTTLQGKFGEMMRTDLQHWGAQGLYTVAQRVPLLDTGWRLEFSYQLPPNLGPGVLNRIELAVHKQGDPSPLLPLIGQESPYQVALEQVR